MRFVSFKVDNYKSFRQTPEIRFSPGLNVIIGQNNVGKTALLESVSLRFGDAPHRSLDTKPTKSAAHAESSSVEFRFEIERAELAQLMRDSLGKVRVAVHGNKKAEDEARSLGHILDSAMTVEASFSPRNGFSHGTTISYAVPPGNAALEFQADATGRISLAQPSYLGGVSPADQLPTRLLPILRERIYTFRAERLNLSEAAIGTDPNLAPNAANLAQVLHLLQSSNPARFRRFQDYVRDIFPQLSQITVPPVGSTARILLWTIDPDTERDDLAISLAESGTGIGQVMAILYVLVTADYPRVVLIDEPHSFLHPAAIRKLLEILLAHRMHQYIISTHSPTALASSNPATITLLTMQGAKTIVRQIDSRAASDLRGVLAEVGARFSDVFGADNILWVEGRTEEASFPLILERARTAGDRATGTVILGVRSTGEFRKKHAAATLDIYLRLTSGTALMPPAVGFIFDSDGLSAQDQNDLMRQSQGRVRFLSRRMFENYILVPEAIAHVANGIKGFRERAVSTEEIADWLAKHKWDRRYFDVAIEEGAKSEALWAQLVDGATLLGDLFKSLSEGRAVYDKVAHGARLTEWLCANAFERLTEISNLLRQTIEFEKARAQA